MWFEKLFVPAPRVSVRRHTYTPKATTFQWNVSEPISSRCPTTISDEQVRVVPLLDRINVPMIIRYLLEEEKVDSFQKYCCSCSVYEAAHEKNYNVQLKCACANMQIVCNRNKERAGQGRLTMGSNKHSDSHPPKCRKGDGSG